MPFFAIICFSLILFSSGCGPSPEVGAVESKARALVTRRATTNEVAAAFGQKPISICTQAEAARHLQETNPNDKSVHHIWETVSKHAYSYSFPLPGGEILIFFDDNGHAVGFYSNIQL